MVGLPRAQPVRGIATDFRYVEVWFAGTTTRRVKHKGKPVDSAIGETDASMRTCKALRRLCQSRTPLFCFSKDD